MMIYCCHSLDDCSAVDPSQPLIPLLGDGQRLRGVIRRGDWMRWRAGDGLPTVLREPVTVTSELPLHQVERLMAESGFTTLPVLENGKFLGLISLRDLLTARASVLAAESRRQVFLRLPQKSVECA